MQSTEYWGDDADMFRPERWLDVDEARREEMLSCLEATFGYGRYKCLGRGVAFMEINKTLPEVNSQCVWLSNGSETVLTNRCS